MPTRAKVLGIVPDDDGTFTIPDGMQIIGTQYDPLDGKLNIVAMQFLAPDKLKEEPKKEEPKKEELPHAS